MSNYSLPFEIPFIPWLTDKILSSCPENTRDFSHLCIVFPGKRPALYLRREMGERLGSPFLPPRIFDIDSFMSFLAKKASATQEYMDANTTDLLYIAHSITKKYFFRVSNLEEFFFWGLKLIDIFDEFEKELISPEDIKRVIPFALMEAGHDEDIKGIWKHMPEFFRAWKEALCGEHIWTNGMRSRIAAENIEILELPFKKIYFSGFTALTKAEKNIFSSLTRRDMATVVVQYGLSSFFNPRTNEDFIQELKDVAYGPWEDISAVGIQNFEPLQTPRINLYHGTDIHTQITLAKEVIKKIPAPDQDMAIILPKSESLMPVLEFFVKDLGSPYNISMGYPLFWTSHSRLLENILHAVDGIEDGKYNAKHYLSILKHPYIKGLSVNEKDVSPEIDFRKLVRRIENWIKKEKINFIALERIISELKAQKTFDPCSIDILSRLHDIGLKPLEEAKTVGEYALSLLKTLDWIASSSKAASHPFAVDFHLTLARILEGLSEGKVSSEKISISGISLLLRSLILQEKIPFPGTPLVGLQVLGMLETRSINFKRLFIFDLNEGTLPPSKSPDLLLPPHVRDKLGLHLHKSQVKIARYHLQRIIGGSEEVHLFFSETSDKNRSRFIDEILWETEKKEGRIDVLPINKIDVPYFPSLPCLFSVGKSSHVLSILKNFTFSPSSIDTYLGCPFRFYAKYIIGIKEEEDISPDDIHPLIVGNLAHNILKDFYAPFLNQEVSTCIERRDELTGICDKHLMEEFKDKSEWSGSVGLFREILLYRLNNFISWDTKNGTGRTLIGLERPYETMLELNANSRCRLFGRIDRIEIDRDGTLWVMDYKTGEVQKSPLQPPPKGGRQGGEISPGLKREELKKRIKSLQLPIYMFLAKNPQAQKSFSNSPPLVRGKVGGRLNACYLKLKGITENSSTKNIRMNYFDEKEDGLSMIKELFEPALKELVSEILNPEIPFDADPGEPKYCHTCPYSKGLCKAV